MNHMPAWLSAIVLLAVVGVMPATDLVEALPLTGQIIMVHLVEGHAVHHQRGEKRTDHEAMVLTHFEVASAAVTDAWTVRAAGDPAFAAGVHPVRVGRKSKGTDFAWMCEWSQADNRVVNSAPDHASDHWLYLMLPSAMTPGVTYTISSTALPGGTPLTLAWSPATARSEAVHVNLMGYVPDVTAKYAYVYHWAGDLGSLDLSSLHGHAFHLINQQTHAVAFSGTVAFRASADRQETTQPNDTPNGNFIGAEAWECDFSTFSTPGTYVVSVDGVGCSFPFRIAADVYRDAFRTTARGLYHNRSGIALCKPFTEFERPAPHNPALTPGFAGKLVYSSARAQDVDAELGNPKTDTAAIEHGIKGPLQAWGWYQDAGDWDSYPSHPTVAATLLFAFETAPANFSDGELHIPESGNGVPDILDEAAWLPRFGQRLRKELLAKKYGTGGLSLRVTGDYFGGDLRKDETTKASYDDVDRQWVVMGEDPWSTFFHAGTCAHLAWCLAKAGVQDPQRIDWLAEAKDSYAWALAHTLPGDEQGAHRADLRAYRAYAAAALFRLTGTGAYEQQLDRDTADIAVGDELEWARCFGPWIHVLGGGAKSTKPELAVRLHQAVLASSTLEALTNSDKRSLRWGGNVNMPMLVGQQTTPWIISGIIGWALTKDQDPLLAQRFRNAVATTSDYFLGTNSLNQTWVTGLGVRSVTGIFHMDAFYNGQATCHPGVVPYGPWRKNKDLGQGPWDTDWPNATVYPAIDQWPGNERWFNNRNCPMSGEFTIHQNTCYAAAVYGWLCAPAAKKGTP